MLTKMLTWLDRTDRVLAHCFTFAVRAMAWLLVIAALLWGAVLLFVWIWETYGLWYAIGAAVIAAVCGLAMLPEPRSPYRR